MQRWSYSGAAAALHRVLQGMPAAGRSTGFVGLDAILFAVLLAFVGIGAWRGALESGLRLFGWVAGYAAATYAGAVLGGALGSRFGLPSWVGAVALGTVVFFVAQLVVAVAIALARRGRSERSTSAPDRVLGAAFGAVRGAIVVVLLGWLGLVAGALGRHGALPALPSLEGSYGARWSGDAIEEGAQLLLGRGDPATRATVALLARPGETLDALHALLDHPRVQALEQDTDFWTRVQAGDVDGALSLASAQALVSDAGLRRDFAAIGLVDPASAGDPVAFERALAAALREASATLSRMQTDPQMRALLRDPEVMGRIRRRDVLGLLASPRFQQALRRASAS